MGCLIDLVSPSVSNDGLEVFLAARSLLFEIVSILVEKGTTLLRLLDEVGRIVLAFCEFFIGELLSLE